MIFSRAGRGVATSVTAVLLAAAPSPVAAKGCSLFTPGVEGARNAPIAQVTDAAKAGSPMTITYEHGPSVAVAAQETTYFNVQIYSLKARPGIYIRQEFETHSDVDLRLYNNAGKEVASSTAFNPVPVSVGPFNGSSDGSGSFGYESITGFRAGRCDQYTLASEGALTPGTTVTLKIWLGRPA